MAGGTRWTRRGSASRNGWMYRLTRSLQRRDRRGCGKAGVDRGVVLVTQSRDVLVVRDVSRPRMTFGFGCAPLGEDDLDGPI